MNAWIHRHTGLQPAGPYDHLDDLVVDEVKAKSWAGVEVPLSIVHKKGLKLDGNNFTEITGYGAHGTNSSPRSDPACVLAMSVVVCKP